MNEREESLYREKQKNRTAGRKRKHKRTFAFLKFVLIIAAGTAVIILLALSPLFAVKSIEVSGGEHYAEENIEAIAGINVGINGFKCISGSPSDIITLSSKNAEQNLLDNFPYLKNADVRFVLPNKISIRLVERKPAFTVPYLGTSLVLDNEGYVMDTAKDPRLLKLPQVDGLKVEAYELGGKIKAQNNGRIDSAVRITEAVFKQDEKDQLKIAGLIDKIDISDENNTYITVDSRITVNLGGLEELDYRIQAMKQIYFKNIKKEDHGLLDFTAGDKPVYKPDSDTGNIKSQGEG